MTTVKKLSVRKIEDIKTSANAATVCAVQV